mgnify:CR=1 FL=1
MDFSSLGKKIIEYAPAIGGALLGPGGAAGGLAVKTIASIFGVSEAEATPEKLEAIINADPEAALKLRQGDWNFQCEMRKLENEELALRLSDIASARQRQTEHEKVTGKTDINIYILAWLVVAGFFVLLGMMMVVAMPQSNVGPVNQLFGAVATGFIMVLTYFFGSSLSSWIKTKLMSKDKG